MTLNEPVAVVGLSCQFPGRVRGPKSFWKMLLDGVDGITEIPQDRWSVDHFYHPSDKQGVKTDSKWGGFVDNIDMFDPYFFGISPKEAAFIDPQQRLLLEASYEAFEDAGMPLEQVNGSKTGVYVGVMNDDFGRLQYSCPDGITSFTNTGTSRTLTANRLSYAFNLQGPSLAVDTACSSSMVCAHLGVVALQNKECDMALIAGVNININPEIFISISKLNMLSPDGRCKAFDESGNGYVRSEGVGVVLLKRLNDALRDHDRIYAVIRGSVVNSDGRTMNPITAPSSITQEIMLRDAYSRSGVDPNEIEYVEAHGTGTFKGDPTELTALGKVLSEHRKEGNEWRVGSVKTNIGHLESASGIAGLIKALLCIYNEGIPPNLHFNNPNPNIPFEKLRAKVVTEYSPWKRQNGRSRKAAVNSFGFGGTNAHLILEEHVKNMATSSSQGTKYGYQLFPISGHISDVIHERAKSYHSFLKDEVLNGKISFHDFHYTATVKRTHFSRRCALVFDSESNLLHLLDACGKQTKERGVLFSNEHHVSEIAFVFSGQGPQWWGMGRELIKRNSYFQSQFEEICVLFEKVSGWSLEQELMKQENQSQVNETCVAQPAIFAIQVALARCYIRLGIVPSAIVGHSIGEVAAAYISGSLSLTDAIQVVYHRSRLQQTVTGGSMLAVELSASEAEELISPYKGRVSIGAVNSPTNLTLSGDTKPLEEIAQELEKREIFNRFLRVKCAFHSIHMQPIEAEMLSSLAHISPMQPKIPVYCSCSGKPWKEHDFDAKYWWHNVRDSVLFNDSVQRIIEEQQIHSFLEISPHPVLASSIPKIVQSVTSRPPIVFSTLKRKEDQERCFVESIGRLYVHGANIEWSALVPNGNIVSLPLYPWQHERYWHEGNQSLLWRTGKLSNRSSSNYALISNATSEHEQGLAYTWRLDLSLERFPFLKDHIVQGNVVVPAAFFIDFIIECVSELYNLFFSLKGVTLHTPLFLSQDSIVHLAFVVSATEAEPSFKVLSSDPETLYVSGTLIPVSEPAMEPIITEMTDLVNNAAQVERQQYYDTFASRGLSYGPRFQGIQKVWRGETNALVELCSQTELELDSNYKWHPALLDATLQGLGGISSLGEISGVGLPVSFDKISLHSNDMKSLKYVHVTMVKTVGQKVYGDLVAIDASANVLAVIKGFCVQFLESVSSETRLEDLLYDITWVESPLNENQISQTQTDQPCVVFGHAGCNTFHLLTQEMYDAGVNVVIVNPTSSTEMICTDGALFKVNPLERKHFTKLFASIGKPSQIVYLWGSSAKLSLTQADTSFLTDVEELITVPIVHICQALTSQDNISLWLLSQGCQSTPGDIESRPIEVFPQNSLWGIGRTAMLEFLEWSFMLCDLPSELGSESARLVVSNILNPDSETEIAIRNGKRWASRLTHSTIRMNSSHTKTVPKVEHPNLDFSLSGKSGSLTTFAFEEISRKPVLDDNVVEIETIYSAINFKDIMYSLGLLPAEAVAISGFTLGSECVGRITRVGGTVSSLSVGDIVVGQCVNGFSSIVYSFESMVFKVPSSIPLDGAATIPTAFATARYGLMNMAGVQEGETVLIHSAAGAVGLAAIQHCQKLGATVIATAGNEEKREFLRCEMNVTHVFNSHDDSFVSGVFSVTGGEGVDVVLNSLAGDLQRKSISVLKRFGRFVEIGKKDIYENRAIGLSDFSRSLTFCSVDLIQVAQYQTKTYVQLMQGILQDMENGTLRPLPVTCFPLSKIKDAFHYMMTGKHVGKIVLKAQDDDIQVKMRKLPCKKNATYMISGGLSGFGLDVAQWMLNNGAQHLVLLGRSGMQKKGIPEKISEMQTLHPYAKIIAAKCDITKLEDVQNVVEQVQNTMPPLQGVIQSAMVLDDGLIVDQNQERIQRVLNPKIVGSWNLHLATRNMSLDHFVMFSSVVSVIGNQGQVSYASANAFMDGLALYRRQLGLPAVSINWGALDDSGYVARNDSVAQQLSSRGVKGLKLKDTLAVLDVLLSNNITDFAQQIPVMDTDWDQFAQFFPLLYKIPRFQPLISSQNESSEEQGTLKQQLFDAPDDHKRLRILSDFIKAQLANILEVNPDKINEQQSFANLGVDSLAAVELRNIIQNSLSIVVSVVMFLQKDSFATIVKQLLLKILKAQNENSRKRVTQQEEKVEDPKDDRSKEVQRQPSPDKSRVMTPVENEQSLSTPQPKSVLQLDTEDLALVREAAFPLISPDSENRFEPFPLNDIQQAYWAGRGSDIELGNSSTHFYTEIESPTFTAEKLEKAIKKLIAHHEMLRCIVRSNGTQQIQRNVPEYKVAVHDFRGLSEAGRQTAFSALREKLSHTKFELDHWPLFNVELSLLSERRSVMHISIDLLVIDGRSLSMFLLDFLHFYNKPEAPSQPTELSFRDYVLAFQEFETHPLYKTSEQYWVSKLDKIYPAPDLPLAKQPDSVVRPSFSRISRVLGGDILAKLEEASQFYSFTPSLVLSSLFVHVLALWSSNSKFTLNLTVFNRVPFHPDVNRLLGDFTSTVLFSVDYDAKKTFGELTETMCKQLLDDLEHSVYSGVRVIRKLAERKGSLLNMPVVFTGAFYKDSPEAFADSYVLTQTPQVWIDNQCMKLGSKLKISWDHVEELFPPKMVEDMFDCYISLITRFGNKDQYLWNTKIADLELLPANQLSLIAEANATDDDSLQPGLIHKLFLEQLKTFSQQTAIVSPQKMLSYAQLHEYAAAVASKLQTMKTRPNQLVGIVMEKGWEAIVAALGILYSGCAYLPIDVLSTPNERIESILKQGESPILITTSSAAKNLNLSDEFSSILVDQLSPNTADASDWLEVQQQSIEDLAYVIFTSGSTGKPKGVAIKHASAVNTILAINQRFNVSNADRTFLLSSLAFDLSVYDIFGALAAGATIVVPSSDAGKDPSVWLEMIREHRISIWNSVPALFKMLTEYLSEYPNLPIAHSLRVAILSGDWIPLELPGNANRVFGNTLALHSFGGATEGSIWSITYPIESVNQRWRSIPYGKPLPNQKFYVLDENLRFCPVHKQGQLFIGGAGVAEGYWKDDERTRESFINLPRTGERIYATGDLGRLMSDGNIEFMGRADTQVKIQGYRIELGEVENALSLMESVKEAVVVPHDNNSKLAAFVVLAQDSDAPKSLLEYKLSRPGIRRGIESTAIDSQLISISQSPQDLELKYSLRKTFREFLPDTLPFESLHALLGNLTSIPIEESLFPKYLYPSAGSLYAVQTYVLVKYGRVDGQKAGAYYLNPESQELVLLADGLQVERFYSITAHAEVNMNAYMQSAFTILLVADIEAVNTVYGEKARDLCLLEAGYMGQLLMEKAASHKIGLCPIGMLNQAEQLHSLLHLDSKHELLHSFVGGLVDYLHTSVTHQTQNFAEPIDRKAKEFLSRQLPSYMVPWKVLEVDQLPLSSTGKIDRRQLLNHPALQHPSQSTEKAVSSLQFDTQKMKTRQTLNPSSETTDSSLKPTLHDELTAIWKNVLSLDNFNTTTDSFFSLGGDSVKAMRVVALANKKGIKITPKQLYQHPKIDDLVSLVAPSLVNQGKHTLEPEREDSQTPSESQSSLEIENLPLTPAQQGLLFHSVNPLEFGMYTQQFGCYINDSLDQEAFREAWKILFKHFSAMRMAFTWRNLRTPYQTPCVGLDFPWRNLIVHSPHALKQFCQEQVQEGFDLETGPLVKFALVQLEQSRYFLATYHHIVLDGWSMSTLLSYAIKLALEIHRHGYIKDPTKFLPMDGFPAFVKNLDVRNARAKQFWSKQLSGYNTVLHVGDNHRFLQLKPREARYQELQQPFSQDLLEGVNRFCEQHNLTLGSFLAGVWAITLKQQANVTTNDIVFGMTFSGRSHEVDLTNQVGLFINSLPIRFRLEHEMAILHLMQQAQNTILGVTEYEQYPLKEVAKLSDLPASQQLFETLLVIENFPVPHASASYFSEPSNLRCPARTNYPVNLLCSLAEGNAVLELSFCVQYVEPYKAQEILDTVLQLTKTIISQPRSHLKDLLPASNQARKQNALVLDRVENQAKTSPEDIAVSTTNHSCTYRQLSEQSTKIASTLLERGVRPNDRICVIQTRDIPLICSIVGIWKANCVYVPVDPSMPNQRLASTINEAEPKIVITDAQTVPKVLHAAPSHTSILLVEDAKPSSELPIPIISPDSAAYIMFTSGSTGKPKGVVVSHSSLINLLECVTDSETGPAICKTDIFAAVTSESFDISILELLAPLIVGGSVRILDRHVNRDGRRLAEELKRSKATIMQATPSTWDLLLRSKTVELQKLCALSGGERLSGALARQLLDLASERGLWNMYGPTETTIWSTFHRVSLKDCTLPSVPIGKPINQTKLLVLDENGNPVDRNTPGELYIGGKGLAKGYFRNPQQTNSAFPQIQGEKLYKTGDLVKVTSDNDLIFLQRVDTNMVKIRGFRVEIGDVEAAILSHSTVTDCRVVARSQDQYQALTAFVHTNSMTTTKSIRQHLVKILPSYMVPSEIHFVEEWPRSTSGKINSEALVSSKQSASPVSGLLEKKPAQNYSLHQVIVEMQTLVATVLNTENRIDPEMNLFEIGLDSISAMSFQSQLEIRYENVTITELFTYPSISRLAKYVVENNLFKNKLDNHADSNNIEEMEVQNDSQSFPASQDVAIIGYTARLPGSDNIDEFWNNLKTGNEGLSRYSEKPELSMDVPAFGQICDVDKFDAQFFGITDFEAKRMDPQLRLFLEAAWTALEDAGYDTSRCKSPVALYSSTSLNTYLMMNVLSETGSYVANFTSSLGESFNFLIQNEKDFVATRTSYLLNLQGPSLNVQTACSSSLVATHMACQGIREREYDMALVGGVSGSFLDVPGTPYDEGSIFSPDGHCRPFDAKANGTVRSNGLAFIVLKRLDLALQDGDNIRAVIKGSAINNDGSEKLSYTAPSVQGQTKAISQALRNANIPPSTISFIETHGTATALGDQIEIQALKNVFQTTKDFSCAIGSVKSNIGHTDVVAGLAGLLKVVLALEKQEIPPTIHFTQPAPNLGLEPHFHVPTTATPWLTHEFPRRAGVSSFGFGGTNVHVILEEAPEVQHQQSSRSHHVLMLTAKSSSSLDRLKESFVKVLPSYPKNELADVCFTSQVGRQHFAYRLFVTGDSIDSICKSLKETVGKNTTNSYREAVFLFPGQGSQYPQFGVQLFEQEPMFRTHLLTVNQITTSEVGVDIVRALQTSISSEHESLQLLILSVEVALAATLKDYGITPSAVIGHSLGEISAAVISQVISLEDAVKMVHHRSKLMESSSPGKMLSIRGGNMNHITAYAELLSNKISIAAFNAPNTCTLSGEHDTISELEAILSADGAECKVLSTDKAFHSPKMDPILEQFACFVSENITLSPPTIPIYSNVTGNIISAAEVTSPSYWAKQIRYPVLFNQCIANADKTNSPVFLELGPGAVLGAFVRLQLSNDAALISVMKHRLDSSHEYERWLSSIGEMWMNHLPVDLSRIYSGEKRRRLRIPTYSFEKTSHWIPFSSNPSRTPSISTGSSIEDLSNTTSLPVSHEIPSSVACEETITSFVKDVFKEMLGLQHVETHDNFFTKGGHSLILSSLVGRINERFQTKIRRDTIFENPSVSNISRIVEQAVQQKLSSTALHPSTKRPETIPASLEQQRIWFLERLHVGSPANLVVGAIQFKSEFDLPAFERTMNLIIAKHETLRTNIILPHKSHVPIQHIHPHRTLHVQEEDASKASETESLVSEIIMEETVHSFNLEQDLLLRVRVVRLPDSSRIIIFILHHIIADGVSLGIIAKELSLIYPRVLLQEPFADISTPLPYQYADYAIEQRNLRNKQQWLQDLQYWKETLADTPKFELPPDYTRPKYQTFTGETLTTFLPKIVTNDLEKQRKVLGYSLFSTMLGFFNAFLHRKTNLQDIVVGTPVSNRTDPKTEKLIGLLLNVVTLRSTIFDNMTISDAIKHSNFVLQQAVKHQSVPFETVVENLNVRRDLSRSPVFQILVVSETEALSTPNIETIEANAPAAQYDLTVFIRYIQSTQRVRVAFNYNTKIFKRQTVELWAAEFQNFISSAVLNMSQTINNVKLQSSLPKAPSTTGSMLEEEQLPQDIFEMVVLNCWKEVLSEQEISIHDSFFDIGGTSFSAVQMVSTVNEALHTNIPLSLVFEAQTVAEIAKQIRIDADFSPQDPLITIRSSGTKQPIYFVHAAGGFALFFRQLAMLLGPDQPFYALEDLSLYGTHEPYPSIESMARAYRERIVATQPSGPYRIGGFCFGGVVAFEIAKQLKAAGETVDPVILLDSRVKPDSNEDVDVLCLFVNQLESLNGKRELTARSSILAERNQEKLWKYAFQLAVDANVIPEGFIYDHFLHFANILKQHLQIQGDYAKANLSEVPKYDVPLFVIRSQDSFDPKNEEETLLWHKVSSGVIRTTATAGSHLTMIYPPYVDDVATIISQELCTDE